MKAKRSRIWSCQLDDDFPSWTASKSIIIRFIRLIVPLLKIVAGKKFNFFTQFVGPFHQYRTAFRPSSKMLNANEQQNIFFSFF